MADVESSKKHFNHLGVTHFTEVDPPALGDDVHRSYLISANWTEEDFILYNHVIQSLIDDKPSVKDMPWAFICEADARIVNDVIDLITSYGMSDAVIIFSGTESTEDVVGTLHTKYDMSVPHIAPEVLDELTPIEFFLTRNGSTAIICTGPLNEFFALSVLTDHYNEVIDSPQEHMVDWREHNLYWYTSPSSREEGSIDNITTLIEKFGAPAFPSCQRNKKKGNVVIFESHYAMRMGSRKGCGCDEMCLAEQLVATALSPEVFDWGQYNIWYDDDRFTRIEISEESRKYMMLTYDDYRVEEEMGYMGDYLECRRIFKEEMNKEIAMYYPIRPEGTRLTSNKVFILMNVMDCSRVAF